jgi:hypothetical protein
VPICHPAESVFFYHPPSPYGQLSRLPGAGHPQKKTAPGFENQVLLVAMVMDAVLY